VTCCGWDLALGLYSARWQCIRTVDFGMRADHGTASDRWGDWLLAGAVIAGSMMSVPVTLPRPLVAGRFAVLAGGIVQNVLRNSRGAAEHFPGIPRGPAHLSHAIRDGVTWLDPPASAPECGGECESGSLGLA